MLLCTVIFRWVAKKEANSVHFKSATAHIIMANRSVKNMYSFSDESTPPWHLLSALLDHSPIKNRCKV